MISSRLLALIALLSVLAPVAARAEPPLWQKVATTPVILLASPQYQWLEPERDLSRRGDGSFGAVDATLKDITPLKGEADDGVVMRQYLSKQQADALDRASGTPVVLFANFYRLDGFPPLEPAFAPMPGTAASVAAVRAEIETQRQQLAAWKPDPGLPHYAEIQRLLDIAANDEDHQAEAFQQIENMGPDSIPAIIALMDDRRQLPILELEVRAPDAIDTRWGFKPQVIADALEVLLCVKTRDWLCNIENGGSDADRRSDIDGWRIYAVHLGTGT